jgi:hypothetical protein
MSFHVRLALLAVALTAAAPSGAAAQWAVTAGIGAARFWGGSREVEGERAFRPYRPTYFRVGLERTARVGLAVRAYYADAGLALEGSEAVVVVKNALSVFGVEAGVVAGVAHLGPSARLVVRAGPFLESWSLSGESSHTRAGAVGSLGVEVGLGRRWSGVLEAGVGVSASPFSQGDLDTGFEPRPLWRRVVQGSLRCNL